MKSQDIINPSETARYFLARASTDGDLITPLKMQKLVYYAYVWTLVRKEKKLFNESIQAWPNGPVVPSLYRELKDYGSMPIGEDYLGDIPSLETKINESELKDQLDSVYEEYIPKSAFELVALTHAEDPWLEGREGLSATEPSKVAIKDSTILEFYAH